MTPHSASQSDDLTAEALRALRDLTGNPAAEFRDGQLEAITALVTGRRRALVVQRTGWGKSAVYFVATRLLRARGSGPVLIVSPLLALMRDQVAAAGRAGIRAVTLNSGNVTEWDDIHAAIDRSEVDVVLVSPERLANPRFRAEVLPGLLGTTGMIVVDEAHCISDWGHDFRPDYRRIGAILATLPTDFPVLATTATANSRVVADVAEQLGTDTLVIRGGLARDSLRLGVAPVSEPAHRLAWLCAHLGDFTGSGIVYTLTVAAAQDTARALRDAGYPVAAYTGAHDAAEREAMEQALLANEVKALVATSALGMGFDKPDLGFVVHLGAPSSPVAYYQQVGRAGRATDSADVLLLPGVEDERIWDYFATASMPSEDSAAAVLAALDESGPLSVAVLETVVGEKRSRLELLLKTLQVDGAVDRVSGGYVSTGAGWTYDAPRYAAVAATRTAEASAMLDYESTTGCRMVFLTTQLDDDTTGDCGRCDTCAGRWWDDTVTEAAVSAAQKELTGLGLPLEPRAMWPTGLPRLGLDLKGKIPAEERPRPGRALARYSDLGTGHRLAELLGPGSTDAPVPQAIGAAVLQVLSEWDWETRPEVVLGVPSPTHPTFLRSLVAGIAGAGRLNDLGELTAFGDPGSPEVNSAFRVRAVTGTYGLNPEQEAGIAGRTVMLVACEVASRWTFTVIARQLLAAGAAAVLPLAAAQRG